MNKKSVHQVLRLLSFLISLGAIGFSSAFFINTSDFVFDELLILMILLIAFGLFSVAKLIIYSKTRKFSKQTIWWSIVFNLCILALSFILLEVLGGVSLIFLPLWILTYHFYFSKKYHESIAPNSQSNSDNLLKTFKQINYFKIAIIVSIIFFLVIFSKISMNGRYQYHDNGVIDTRTGSVYILEYNTKNGVDYQRPMIPRE